MHLSISPAPLFSQDQFDFKWNKIKILQLNWETVEIPKFVKISLRS